MVSSPTYHRGIELSQLTMWHPTSHVFGWLALIFASHRGLGILKNLKLLMQMKRYIQSPRLEASLSRTHYYLTRFECVYSALVMPRSEADCNLLYIMHAYTSPFYINMSLLVSKLQLHIYMQINNLLKCTECQSPEYIYTSSA